MVGFSRHVGSNPTLSARKPRAPLVGAFDFLASGCVDEPTGSTTGSPVDFRLDAASRKRCRGPEPQAARDVRVASRRTGHTRGKQEDRDREQKPPSWGLLIFRRADTSTRPRDPPVAAGRTFDGTLRRDGRSGLRPGRRAARMTYKWCFPCVGAGKRVPDRAGGRGAAWRCRPRFAAYAGVVLCLRGFAAGEGMGAIPDRKNPM
jgi:hypothetical protein